MNDINSKSILKVLNGQRSEKVPFWFMRQAGRYLPEYRELRAKKGGFLDMACDPVAACEITMQPIRRFGMDAAIIFSDILVIPHALGQHLEFVAGEGPKLDPIRDQDGLKNLSQDNLHENLGYVYQALKNTRLALKAEGFEQTTLIGFAGAPWTVACYMVEGQGSKDFAHLKKFAYGDPEGFGKLMDLLVQSTSDYLIRQAEAGAEVLQIFDSWAGVLSADYFERYSIQPTKEIVQRVKAAHPEIPIIGFPRGGAHMTEAYCAKTGIDAVGLDTQVPTGWASKTLQPKLPVQGNLDPIALLAGGDEMEKAARKILDDFSANPFIFNLGHGINKETPIAHVERLVEIIREY